mmetsp:Transcript_26375/g.87432  ORF Transcript_26375/g.87432 Transcript_26375/m.87432 type:complete len:560 (-) Transcript_26375:1-1680(-)
MDLVELAGSDDADLALQPARKSSFLAKLAHDVDALVINLDLAPCQALLEKIDASTPQGEVFVEMTKLRRLRVVGSSKHWHSVEQPSMRLLQLLQPSGLEELALVGVDQMKVVRSILSNTTLHSTLTRLHLGLHGFHFLAQEDLLALGVPLAKLKSLRLSGTSASGVACRESYCRMFICANAFLEYLGQLPRPEEIEVIQVSNAGLLGDDHQIANVLRSLASFPQLRRLRLPLPSLPLAFRELLTMRLALPHLLFFVVDPERVEGADEWPEDAEEWPAMTEVWPTLETISPLSVFAREFSEVFENGEEVAEEWERLSDAERGFWLEATPRIRSAYRRWERAPGGTGHPSQGQAAGDTDGVADDFAEAALAEGAGGSSPSGGGSLRRGDATTWRASPEPRASPGPGGQASSCGLGGPADQGSPGGGEADARRATTHGAGDWRAEERSALRGFLGMKASDVCRDKARLRREGRGQRLAEAVELADEDDDDGGSGRTARAVQDVPSVERLAMAEELFDGNSAEQCCAREDGRATAYELGVDEDGSSGGCGGGSSGGDGFGLVL